MKDGEKKLSTHLGRTWAIQRTSIQKSSKNYMRLNQTRQTNTERLIKEGKNRRNRKVFGQNTKKRFQKQLGHPLALEVPLHGKHFCLTHPIRKNKRKKPIQMGHPKP
jgi:hypothetical protein